MQKRIFQLFIVLLLLIPTLQLSATAKAYFASKQEMIKKADAIAVVLIKKIESCDVHGSRFKYSEKAIGSVEKVLKGNLPTEITMYGGEDFICAQVHYMPGKGLVFLSHDGSLLRGSNWYLSVRPIKEGKIKWYSGDSWFPLTSQSESEVIAEVQKEIAQSK